MIIVTIYDTNSETLYVFRLLTWYEDTKKLGFSLEYPNISLHAIRREPIPSLYMMVDCKLDIPGEFIVITLI